MPDTRYARLVSRIQTALQERAKRESLYRAMKRGRDNRAQAFAELEGRETFRQEVREVKLRALNRQDELIEQFAAKARERGANVFFAQDGSQAVDYVLQLARRIHAQRVIKSKSLTSEEILINHPLEEAGMEVIETDLGELIIQQVHEKPFHLVFPAVHKTAQEVAAIFSQKTGQPIPPEPKEIMKVVRAYLRPIFLNADIGMTGANIAIAETGAIVIETNEGNGRLVSSIPDVHVCIMGREKVVETVEDALKLVLAHPLSSVGQRLTTYVTFMAGRSPLGEGERPRESHIIILDNGRTRMREDPVFYDALNCIRCGACMNICPTYGVVGGHTFGYIYPGPIGIPWTAQVHGLERAGDFAPLCISCGLCQEICPVEIDIPMMIAEVKHRDMAQHPQPRVNRVMMSADRFARFGSATAPLSNWMLRRQSVRVLMEKLLGIDRRRELPPFARRSLEKRWKTRQRPPARETPRRKVAFFVDVYANYNAPELGMAAIEELERLGCEVVLPPQKPSGYPYIGYGDLDPAQETAAYNVRQLAPYVERGYDIVATEPTATYCLKISYPKLLPGDDQAQQVAAHAYEFFEYLLMLLEEQPLEEPPRSSLRGKRFGFHVSCHQRPLGAGIHAMEWLRRLGADVTVIETGTCCGMGGTFGLKAGPLGYDLSQAVGEPLFQQFRESGVEAIVTESSVCRIHLHEGTGLPVVHPLELLRSRPTPPPRTAGG